MKKALLYTLLFVLLSIVVIFAMVFAVPYLFWNEPEAGGQGSSVFDDYPLLLPSITVISWSLITLFIFIKNKYSDISFGNISPKDRLKFVLLGGVSMVLLKSALTPLMWIVNNEVSETRYSIIQMWMHNDVLVSFLLALMHLTLEAVFFSAILRELIIWSKRPIISIFVVALLSIFPNTIEFSASSAVPLLCTFIPMVYGGWLYYRTSSIWPVFFGMVSYDVLLLFTPLFKYVSFVIASALILPWLVIYIYRKLSDNVKPIISR